MRKKEGPLFHAPQRKGLDYTQRQLEILSDEIPLEKVKTTELVKIIRRAAEREDELNLGIAKNLYDAKTNPNKYRPNMSVVEAKIILQRLTPWVIDWRPKKKSARNHDTNKRI